LASNLEVNDPERCNCMIDRNLAGVVARLPLDDSRDDWV
jgi:hypothetical protein